ncbi:macro domain-containing protein [Sphingopyxis sp. P8]|uniref:macro domain-containing protein n=1 Tax=Sphingopyxis sp. P8 TaxID=2763256 RepID=UPI001D0B950D|nr:macro domain-containing protein [Sphingopyxis sp. P8]
MLDSPAQTLVNTVNCVGVMGKGLAREFKGREPSMFTRYKEICDRSQLQPGKLWLWRGVSNWVLNFPTKVHWRNPSRIEWIEEGLQKFVDTYEDLKIREISFPRLGCGNGNLDWEDVKPLMEHFLKRVRIPVYIHDFQKDIGIPEHLEMISDRAAEGIPLGVEFETFVNGLRVISTLGGDSLVDLNSNQAFKARVNDCQSLQIESNTGTWEFDAEDLHGVWVSLLRGLVTKERAEWSKGEGGNFIITLLSMLPNTRPVEIQRGNEPEIAVELQPWARRIGTTSPAHEQLRLEWH